MKDRMHSCMINFKRTHARSQKKVERTLQMNTKHTRTYFPTQVKNSLQTKAEHTPQMKGEKTMRVRAHLRQRN